jgi:glyoxalase family protein
VNFDDPGTYHLYYGDAVGTPGTIFTFFPWPGARRGRSGAGQTTETAFAAPPGSLGFWSDRLARLGVAATPGERFGAPTLTFLDPDGMRLELVEGSGAVGDEVWTEAEIPAAQALRGFAGVTLTERNPEVTAEVLSGTLGFRLQEEGKGRWRFAPQEGGGGTIDLLADPAAERGSIAAGSVHHVAFRAHDDADQLEWRSAVERSGLQVTPVLDRQYFHSIYFREPGGVLFEIATDPPGFTRDEPREGLGSRLQLPPWLEPHRTEIEGALPPLELRTAPEVV